MTVLLPRASLAADDWWSTHLGNAAEGGAADKTRGHDFALEAAHTFGWSLLTPRERAEHRELLVAVKSPKECQAVGAAHERRMRARAAAAGKARPVAPRANNCTRLRTMGLLK